MVRFLALFAIIFAAATPAGAQTLVQNPPVYKAGERYTGTLDIEGEIHRLHQRVEQVGTKTVVVGTIADSTGTPVSTTFYDPLTWLSETVNEEGKSKVVETTCSADDVYPIYLGKQYACVSRVREHGEIITVHMILDFNEAEKGRDGHIIGLCNISHEIDKDITIKARTCRTPDGKWIRSIEVLDYFITQ